MNGRKEKEAVCGAGEEYGSSAGGGKFGADQPTFACL